MQVHWANEKSNKEERLISIALDGNILEWKIQKNLNVKTLMALKRVNTNNSVIARYASGKLYSLTFICNIHSNYNDSEKSPYLCNQ